MAKVLPKKYASQDELNVDQDKHGHHIQVPDDGLACAADIVSQTAIELIKTRFVDDADGKAAIIAANRHQSLDAEKQFQYDLWRSRGLSEGKIWRAFATIYGGDPESHKKRLKRKFKADPKG